jgi:hypothetical protein
MIINKDKRRTSTMNKNEAIFIERLKVKKTISEMDRMDWLEVSKNKVLSEDFIREFQDKVDWGMISIHSKLSEDFIREFSEKVEWFYISFHSILSENFIREFQNKVYWSFISRHHLSDDFVEEFKDRVDWKIYFEENRTSFDIIKKFIFKTDLENTKDFETAHLNNTQIQEIEKLFKLKKIFK